MRYDNYRGEIEYNGERFAFMPATLGDVEQLAEMYGDVAITDKNYRVKLRPGHEENFSHTGGMLEIHTRDSVAKEIRNGNSCLAVAKSFGGRIIACLWFGPENPHFADFDPEAFSRNENSGASIARAYRDGLVAYPREPICRLSKLHKAAQAMFFTVFSFLARNGYTHSLLGVYALHGYRLVKREFELDMLNQRYYDMCSDMGGKFIGSLPEFDVTRGLLTVTVSPKVICCELAAILPRLEEKLHDVGIKIFFS